ncbi:GNAT family N-acetyltransferase [Nisaea nitritireducens]|uniref:GNAT family N-acetyltransferase n=1 Tax=Nisaea nitritireducens TaxID=568392 RepID=UPI001866F312|nr:GNAT family N-acetyltransferase [Nisaea nitritireducens]
MPATQIPEDIKIRTATAEEAVEIANFHVKIWRETYKDMAPEEAIRVLNEDRRLPGWIETLTSTDVRKNTQIALADGKIVGLVSYGPPTSKIFGDRGEIKHLYVDGSQRGRGLGGHLLRQAFQQMGELDFEGVGLSVVRDNMAARHFYKSLGGTEHAEFRDPGPIWKSSNILMIWPAGAETR